MSEQDNDLRDLSELYAIGLLEEPELSRFEEALKSGSEEAQRLLKAAMETNAIVMSNVPLVEPPARLRRKVMAAVGAPERQWSAMLAWAGLAASLAVGVFYFRGQEQARSSEIAQLRDQMEQVRRAAARTETELRQAQHVLEFLNAPETRMVTFGPADPKPPRGRVLLNPTRGVLLIASNLPAAPAGKIYEMWVIPKGGAPVPAGLFQSDAAGNALHLQPGAVPAGATVAVTVEPASGSQTPTMPIVFAATL